MASSGCGFHATAAHDNNGPIDASDETGQIDAPTGGPTDCLGHWFGGTLTISAPQPLANQSTTANERDPWISVDRLTLYYASDPSGVSMSDIYRATRATTTQPFGNGTRLVNLDTNAEEGRPALTPDEKILVLSSNRGTNQQFDFYMTTRPDTTTDFGSPDTRHLASVNTASTQHFDPFLTADGLKLYLSPAPTASPQHIFVATRTDTNSDFGAPAPVPVINSAANNDADPALSLDERIILFSSDRPTGVAGTAGLNLWYATRQSAADNFSSPRLIPMVNSDRADGDPMLSADGCELYFSSTRAGTGSNYDLYTAQISR